MPGLCQFWKPQRLCAILAPCSVLATLGAASIGALSLISVSDEIALGRETQRQIRKDIPLFHERAVTDYVTRLGRQLAQRAPGPKYPYTFSIANYRELNAFALPGGPVWIHRGVIHAARSEFQLAGVVAHEIAHIAQRHAADQVSKQLVANGLLGLLGAVLGNNGGGRTAQMAARVLAGGSMLKFSRDDEIEADRIGMQILQRAGWDPRGIVGFMEILRNEQRRDPGAVEVFLSSHPAPLERIDLMRRGIKGTAGGRRDSAAFREVKIRVQKMPPPRSLGKSGKSARP